MNTAPTTRLSPTLARLRAVVATALAGVAVAALWSGCGRVDAVAPVPENLAALDPEVVSLVRKTVDEISEAPRNAEIRRRLGMIYEANRLHRFARTCYEQAIEIDDGDARTWQRLAACHDRIGDLDAAIAAMREAIRRDGDHAAAHWQLAHWLLDVGETVEVQALLDRAIAIDPTQPEAWYGFARLQLSDGEPERAMRVIESHDLRRGRYGAYGTQLLATAYRRLGQLDEAERVSASGRSAGGIPDFAGVWGRELLQYRVGIASLRTYIDNLVKARRFDEARQFLARLLRENPADIAAMNVLASVELESGNFARGFEVLRAALEVDEDDFQTNLTTALALARKPGTSSVDLEEAIRLVDRALAVRPVATNARRVRVHILEKLGRLPEAIDEIETAYAHDSRDVVLLVSAGRMRMTLGRWPDAASTFRRVLSAAPNHVDARLWLAESLLELGDADGARVALDDAAAIAPDNPRVDEVRRRLRGHQTPATVLGSDG